MRLGSSQLLCSILGQGQFTYFNKISQALLGRVGPKTSSLGSWAVAILKSVWQGPRSTHVSGTSLPLFKWLLQGLLDSLGSGQQLYLKACIGDQTPPFVGRVSSPLFMWLLQALLGGFGPKPTVIGLGKQQYWKAYSGDPDLDLYTCL